MLHKVIFQYIDNICDKYVINSERLDLEEYKKIQSFYICLKDVSNKVHI